MADITTEDRREFARLRRLMIKPAAVQLARSDHGRRAWLTDKYVLLDITGSPVIRPGLEDGGYRLAADKGLVATKQVAAVNLPLLFGRLARLCWYPAHPTGWSVTDSEAKALLMYVDATAPGLEPSRRLPLAMNEDVWRAFSSAYPEISLWHAGYEGPFRVAVPGCFDLAYIEPIRIPEELHRSAILLVEAL